MEPVTATALLWHLRRFRYNLADEDSIQIGVDEALRLGDYEFEREARLSPTERVDFLVGGVAIEVKRRGTSQDLLRQLSRYAQHDRVRELLVVTARAQASDLPDTIGGKPIQCLVLLGSVF